MSADWKVAILKTIKFLGGNATNKQIYEDINNFKDLSEYQTRETDWGGRPAYQHAIRSYLSDLTVAGLLEQIRRG